jgi:hypothetical protein
MAHPVQQHESISGVGLVEKVAAKRQTDQVPRGQIRTVASAG